MPIMESVQPYEHKEYDLEVQAIIDLNIGDHQVRYSRAIELVQFLADLHLGNVIHGKQKKFQELVVREFCQPAVFNNHGIATERRQWQSIELDQLVIGVNLGYSVGIDELGSIYGLHGNRVGIELITTPWGIVYQNSNQLTTKDWWERMTAIMAELKPEPLALTN